MTAKVYKGALSRREGQRCEDAKHPTCRCRCNGVHHGAGRGPVESLQAGDPHFPAKKCKRCNGTGKLNSGMFPDFPCYDCKGQGWILSDRKATAKADMTLKDHRGYFICRLCGYAVPDADFPPGQGLRDYPFCTKKATKKKKLMKDFFKRKKAESKFGPAYDAQVDGARLENQLNRNRDLMLDGHWRTLIEIQGRTGDPEASVSAQLRHLRKDRFGAYAVEKRRRIPKCGLWEYRLLLPEPEAQLALGLS